jgi:hypothetical protein
MSNSVMIVEKSTDNRVITGISVYFASSSHHIIIFPFFGANGTVVFCFFFFSFVLTNQITTNSNNYSNHGRGFLCTTSKLGPDKRKSSGPASQEDK